MGLNPASSRGSSSSGGVSSVTAADTSIVVAGTASDPTLTTGTLDLIATDQPPAADVPMNGQKITGLADGTDPTDAAAFGQLPAGVPGVPPSYVSPNGFAQGFIGATGSYIETGSAKGGFAQGYANYGGTIAVSNPGTFAQGQAFGSGAVIQSIGGGSFAQGAANDGAIIHATSSGSFAQGAAYGAGSEILAGGSFGAGAGMFAQGRAAGGGVISATAYGAFAQGRANSPSLLITASAYGSFAQGEADTASIIASASNAVQFGPGENDLANSLQVGVGIRLSGLASAPGSPKNGDFWTDGTDVFVQTGGAAKNLSDVI